MQKDLVGTKSQVFSKILYEGFPKRIWNTTNSNKEWPQMDGGFNQLINQGFGHDIVKNSTMFCIFVLWADNVCGTGTLNIIKCAWKVLILYRGRNAHQSMKCNWYTQRPYHTHEDHGWAFKDDYMMTPPFIGGLLHRPGGVHCCCQPLDFSMSHRSEEISPLA